MLHLEPTDVCQAACPLCARELDPAFRKSSKHHLQIDQMEKFDEHKQEFHSKKQSAGNLYKIPKFVVNRLFRVQMGWDYTYPEKHSLR